MPIYKRRSYPKQKRMQEYHERFCKWRPHRILATHERQQEKQFIRIYGLHKLSVLAKNTKRAYNYTIICDAKIGRGW